MRVLLFAILAVILAGATAAYAQEPQLATFQEIAQVIIDGKTSGNVTASVTLQSTSSQEIMIPPNLEQKILKERLITSVILTNEEQCVLGVSGESCIMINMDRSDRWADIVAIHEGARQIGDGLIDDLNSLFGADAVFHSVFVHQDGDASRVFDTSGSVTGRGTISVVYTMPMRDTASMYQEISELVHARIRDSGGFYDTAKSLSGNPGAKMTLSAISLGSSLLYQIKTATTYDGAATDTNRVRPLEYLQADQLRRSEYFSDGFYPLNSLLHVVVLSPKPVEVADVAGDVLPFEVVIGDKIPTDVSRAGWVFDPESGSTIVAKFIFGNAPSIEASALGFSLVDPWSKTPSMEPAAGSDDQAGSLLVLAVIVAAGAGAAIYYIKGYKKA